MNNFKPTFLYIKQHSVTGKLYFGKTVRHPEKYYGSGRYWTQHIKKHGKEHVINLWFCLFLDFESIRNFALKFSIEQDIVNSKLWANEIYETCLDGGSTSGLGNGVFGKPSHWRGKKLSNEHIAKIVNSRKETFKISGAPKLSKETKEKISKTISKLFEDPTKNPMYGKYGKDNPNFGKKRTDEFKKAQSERLTGDKNGMFGKHLSEEAKQKKSEKMKGYVYEKKLCPHCNKLVGITGGKRWHFDNCKSNPNK